MSTPTTTEVNTLKFVSFDGQPYTLINKTGVDTKTLAYATDEGLPAALAADPSASETARVVIVFMM